MPPAAVPDELLARIRRFHDHPFPGVQEQFQTLIAAGQHPSILFIGCAVVLQLERLMGYPMVGICQSPCSTKSIRLTTPISYHDHYQF